MDCRYSGICRGVTVDDPFEGSGDDTRGGGGGGGGTHVTIIGHSNYSDDYNDICYNISHEVNFVCK